MWEDNIRWNVLPSSSSGKIIEQNQSLLKTTEYNLHLDADRFSDTCWVC